MQKHIAERMAHKVGGWLWRAVLQPACSGCSGESAQAHANCAVWNGSQPATRGLTPCRYHFRSADSQTTTAINLPLLYGRPAARRTPCAACLRGWHWAACPAAAATVTTSGE